MAGRRAGVILTAGRSAQRRGHRLPRYATTLSRYPQSLSRVRNLVVGASTSDVTQGLGRVAGALLSMDGLDEGGISVFGWLRRTRAGNRDPRRTSSGYPKKRVDDGYWQKAEQEMVAALTGDQREEYLAALTELSETMDELGIEDFRECTRSFTPGGPVVLTPAEIRQRTARIRNAVNSIPPDSAPRQ